MRQLITTTGDPHKAYRRHVIIDNINKVILIEVQANLIGKLKEEEYRAILDGQWYKYVPTDFIPQLRQAIGGGYTVQPIMAIGQENEEYRVIQLVDLKYKNLTT